MVSTPAVRVAQCGRYRAMSNARTGDFDAVVQFSLPTINRVLASMHQNPGPPDGSPRFLHRLVAPIGKNGPQGGGSAAVGGFAAAQPSTPSLALAAHATPEVIIECPFRAPFVAAPR